MITSLKISNLAIIDHLEIDFASGFNVITGETGAGKSILIRALNFLIGAKASSEQVRRGAETATVIGEFFLPAKHPAIQALANLSIEFDEEPGGSTVVIRRLLHSNGRSQSWINDQTVSIQGLREVGETLIDVFQQHENQKLLNPKWHLHYIDVFLSKPATKKEYQRLFTDIQIRIESIRSQIEGFLSVANDKDYMLFRLEELTGFSPSTDDYETALHLSKSSVESKKQFDTFSKALASLEDEEVSVSKRVWTVSKYLSTMTVAGDLAEQAKSIATSLDELSFQLGQLVDSTGVDEETIESAETRIAGYQALFRKHAVRTVDELVEEQEKLQKLTSGLASATQEVEASLKMLLKDVVRLTDLAQELSKDRLTAATKIRKAVETELKDLSMPNSRFETKWNSIERELQSIPFEKFNETLVPHWEKSRMMLTTLGAHGREDAEFLLSTNAGESVLPLIKTASGGELSRIMLALKKAIATDAETCVLVFDEIDSGISGRVADVVGKKMRELSNHFQVICISHLAQVAAYADQHLLVEKSQLGKRTESRIVKLSPEESIQEIARLLSGDEVTASSLANARQLVEKAIGKTKPNKVRTQTKPPGIKKKANSRPSKSQ